MLNNPAGEALPILRRLFAPGRTIGSEQSMPALLALGREIGSDAGEALVDRYPELQDLVPCASRDYLEFISRQERAEAAHLLARKLDGSFRYAELAEAFGKHNYDRVHDMFDAVDFRSCRRFVLVGCGPLPMTLYHVYDRTGVPELVALDSDAEAIDIVAATARHFGLNRLSAQVISGETYDYADSDVIYVANLVRPKRTILQRIADTARRSTRIVLREPYSLGRLLTERGADDLNPRLEIEKLSPPELTHFSRHVFLRFADSGAG